MIKYKSSQSGFSLVETLVAITILLLVIIGPMTISSSTAKSTSFASEQVQAFFLAQEGAEIVQKVRDGYILTQFAGATGQWGVVMNVSGPLSDCFGFNNSCGLDLNDDGTFNSIVCSASNNDCALYYNAGGGRAKYTHDSAGGVGTKFTREIILTTMSTDQVKVQSIVKWRTGSLKDSQKVEVETYLFNVYDF
jgi:prepilin-type N-terminal cleavage/methylation domain-containing protein